MRHLVLLLAILASLAVARGLAVNVRAAEDSAEAKKPTSTEVSDEKLIAAVAAMAREVADKCEFAVGDAGATKLSLHHAPILRWSNPTVGKVFGEVHLWTDHGRPAVVASLYRGFSPDWGDTLEVCSLAADRLVGRMDDVRFWTPAKSGLTLKPLPDADSPAKSPAARLVQMRRLAGEFATHLADTRGDDSGVKRQLRLLTQPVFRYPAANAQSQYADGALFAFVEGTDPEALLLLEATNSDGETRWQYGLARMNRDAMRVTFHEETVWTVPKLDDVMGLSREPYAVFSLERPLKAAAPNDDSGRKRSEVKP